MRRICVVTGTRAEYGLLRWLMEEIEEDPRMALQLLVTGAHLAPEFGLTYREIEADGFGIDEKVEMLLSGDSATAVTKSLALGVLGCADALDRLRPDVLVVLGDRYEVLAAVQAALVARVPVAHIHGGETTEGAIDEAIRHAVTKMSHLHFVAAEPYARRVIQLGESPDRVYEVGAPGLDNIERLSLLNREELEESLGVELHDPVLLVTYHPATLKEADPADGLERLLDALQDFPDAQVIFTMSNADVGGRTINRMIGEAVAAAPGRMSSFVSLGQVRYLSLLREAAVVVGNSSSGLIEAPAVGTPTVNVGDRQRGRLRGESVIDCGDDREAIAAAIRTALSDGFRTGARRASSPYGRPGASRKISEILATRDLDGILMKSFHDL